MDPDAVLDSAAGSDLSQQIELAASSIEQLRVQLHIRLRGEYWFGERADSIRRSWETTVGPALDENVRLLRTMSRAVTDTAGGDTVDDTSRA